MNKKGIKRELKYLDNQNIQMLDLVLALESKVTVLEKQIVDFNALNNIVFDNGTYSINQLNERLTKFEKQLNEMKALIENANHLNIGFGYGSNQKTDDTKAKTSTESWQQDRQGYRIGF